MAKSSKATKKVESVAKVENAEFRKKVLFVASEAQPFCATGGLADVCGSLPKEIRKNDPSIDIRTIIPLYSNIPNCFRKDFKFIGHIYVTLSWRKEYAGVFEYDYENNIRKCKRCGFFEAFEHKHSFSNGKCSCGKDAMTAFQASQKSGSVCKVEITMG